MDVCYLLLEYVESNYNFNFNVQVKLLLTQIKHHRIPSTPKWTRKSRYNMKPNQYQQESLPLHHRRTNQWQSVAVVQRHQERSSISQLVCNSVTTIDLSVSTRTDQQTLWHSSRTKKTKGEPPETKQLPQVETQSRQHQQTNTAHTATDITQRLTHTTVLVTTSLRRTDHIQRLCDCST